MARTGNRTVKKKEKPVKVHTDSNEYFQICYLKLKEHKEKKTNLKEITEAKFRNNVGFRKTKEKVNLHNSLYETLDLLDKQEKEAIERRKKYEEASNCYNFMFREMNENFFQPSPLFEMLRDRDAIECDGDNSIQSSVIESPRRHARITNLSVEQVPTPEEELQHYREVERRTMPELHRYAPMNEYYIAEGEVRLRRSEVSEPRINGHYQEMYIEGTTLPIGYQWIEDS